MRNLVFSVLLLSSLAVQANQQSLTVQPGSFRFSYETLTLPGDESMGLLGGNYLYDFGFAYGGLAAYGALTGERGGFFTGGYELGKSFPLTQKISLDGGFFIGGGGGGSAPQGGGLMWRPQLALHYAFNHYSLGMGISRVSFPNGDIHSTQYFLSFENHFNTLFASPGYARTAFQEDILNLQQQGYALSARTSRVLAELKYYWPREGVVRTTGQPHEDGMRVIGVQYQAFSSQHLYTSLATYGANGGGVDGFAQVMFGAGLLWPLGKHYALTVNFAAGGAGGGQVATGGGLILTAGLGWQMRFNDHWGIGIDAGYLIAPSGDFEAVSLGGAVLYQYDAITISRGAPSTIDFDQLESSHWRWRLAHQTYFPQGQSRKPSSGVAHSTSVDLIGAQVDLFVAPAIYLTGQALGAYDGGAGGYAIGLIGLGGLYTVADIPVSLGAELTIGAAGGGGLAVADGLIYQPMLSLAYQFNDRWSASLAGGVIDAMGGPFEAKVLQFSLDYHFSDLYLNPWAFSGT